MLLLYAGWPAAAAAMAAGRPLSGIRCGGGICDCSACCCGASWLAVRGRRFGPICGRGGATAPPYTSATALRLAMADAIAAWLCALAMRALARKGDSREWRCLRPLPSEDVVGVPSDTSGSPDVEREAAARQVGPLDRGPPVIWCADR